MWRRPRCARRADAPPERSDSGPWSPTRLPSSIGRGLVLFGLASAACKAPSAPADSTPGAASPAADETTDAGDDATPSAGSAETETRAPARVAESGLDPGEKLRPFDAVDVTSDERYCPVCRFADTPVIVLVGAADDPEFHEDLADVEAVLARHRPFGARVEDDPVKAFALVGTFDEAGLDLTPDDRGSLVDAAAQVRRQKRLHMPVLVPAPPSADADSDALTEHYRFRRGRTLMLADADGVVLWSAVAPPHLAEFDAALAPLMR